ncbi:CsbD family protein [Nocardia arthritidis]|uniref:CsbD family protein n=1 Tax=Nocardia arthritidis TaxID=228602 RepID=A0A6G9YMH5_9NOCA|nr:CsbD family protein [Nocardia arthritidis]QIS14408.1 CsbD family protein [Nocardia arthritidis]
MSEHRSGPREGIEGVVEDVKGKAKEAAGIVTGDEGLEGEGRAQQDKAASQRAAAAKEAAAEKARTQADIDEQRERARQGR